MHADSTLIDPFSPKLCECGCGLPTSIAKWNNSKNGYVKGQPLRYVKGHHPFLSITERFWKYVTPGPFDQCWFWTASLTTNGYGNMSIGHTHRHAHRVSWQIHYGPIPDGMEVCHDCDKNYQPGDITYRRCCNPYHLFLGTHQDNMDDRNTKNRQAHPTGESGPNALLNDALVHQMRDMYKNGMRPYEIAEHFKINYQTVYSAITYYTWAHLP